MTKASKGDTWPVKLNLPSIKIQITLCTKSSFPKHAFQDDFNNKSSINACVNQREGSKG